MSTCPPLCNHSTTSCSLPCTAARMISCGSQASPASCKFAGLSSTAPASPSTATSYRPLAASKRPATPRRPLSSGRALRPPMRTRRADRLGVGAATAAGDVAACCWISSTMAVWPLLSAVSSAVWPLPSSSSVLAPAASSSCTHSWLPW
eukprot:scaffold1158_cov66-Phaeocystis_antarctica.AAC.3